MTDPIDLGEYRKWHTEDELSGLCVVCKYAFPCDAIRLADEVDRLRSTQRNYRGELPDPILNEVKRLREALEIERRRAALEHE